MPAPSTLAKIKATLKALYPPTDAMQSDASTLGLERNSIAYALARANDAVEALFDEQFPDTASQLIERWEKVTRVPTRTSDAIADRRTRVLSVLRRTSGPRIAQLEQMLAGPLATDVSNLVWVEGLRSDVEALFTQTTGTVALAVPTTTPGLTLNLGKPWPGVVDGAGVQVYLAMSGHGTTTATLTSPSGTVWTIPVNAATGWYFNRTAFTGQIAAGKWLLNVYDSSSPTLTEARVMVSNDVDSSSIYQFFVLRDPALAGTADLVEAQRLFHRTALGNMQAKVVETLALLTDDPHSLTDRDPLGV